MRNAILGNDLNSTSAIAREKSLHYFKPMQTKISAYWLAERTSRKPKQCRNLKLGAKSWNQISACELTSPRLLSIFQCELWYAFFKVRLVALCFIDCSESLCKSHDSKARKASHIVFACKSLSVNRFKFLTKMFAGGHVWLCLLTLLETSNKVLVLTWESI